MNDVDSGQSMRLWSTALCSFYLVALLLGSFLAYIGILWVDAYERGWRTQIAAAAIVAAWFPLALAAAFSWKAARASTKPRFLWGIGFVVIAIAFYAVAMAWDGHMMI